MSMICQPVWARRLVSALLLALPAWSAGPAVAAVGAPQPPPDVFGGYASDRIIVKFKPDAFPGGHGFLSPSTKLPGPQMVPHRVARTTGTGAASVEPRLSAPLRTAMTQWRMQRIRPAYPDGFESPHAAATLGLDRTFLVEVPVGTDAPAMAAALRAFAGEIEWAGIDGIGGVAELIPNDEWFIYQYAMRNEGQSVGGVNGLEDADIDATDAWELHTGDLGTVTVAIIDSGVDAHPEFASRLVQGINTADPNNPNDQTEGSCFFSGGIQHGTHVTGIVAALGNNTVGVAGVTWGAYIMPVRVLNGCSGVESGAAAGIIWAVDHGADICNMSLQYCNGSQVLEDAVNYAHALGVLVVAAAGNSNLTCIPYPQVTFPARFENAMAVSATNNRDQFYTFSRYGDQVEIAAPGWQVISTKATSGYDFASGTSMATPHVSGVAALMLSYVPGMPHTAIRNILRASADDLGDPGWDQFFGDGRLNAYQALLLAEDTVWMISSVPPDGAIDARQPSDPQGNNPAGWDRLDVTFSGDAAGVTNDKFSVTVDGVPDPPPEVVAVLPTAAPETVTLVLDQTIPLLAWTTITHDLTGTKVRLGYLPGDVNGDGTSSANDVLTVIDALNGLVELAEWQTDVDRSGETAPPDILRVIDLLNGAGVYEAYLDVSLPE